MKNPKHLKIAELSDGVRKAREIGEILGLRMKYVHKIWKRYDLPRPKQGPPSGECNPSWSGGRVIERDGYVTIPGTDRIIGRSLEHRRVIETQLGRKLLKTEVIDHIDGCRLHNCPKNLRVFESNGDHLKATLSGKIPRWSPKGFSNIGYKKVIHQRVDTYNQRKKRGDVRLQQILLAHGLLGKDSPYLLGTHRYLERAGIPYQSMTKRDFLELAQQLELAHET